MKKTLEERQAEMRQRQLVPGKRPAQAVRASVPGDPFEPPYTVAEVANLTGFSVQTVIRIFAKERGVLIYDANHPRRRASYRSIRIPRYVYRRVMRDLTLE